MPLFPTRKNTDLDTGYGYYGVSDGQLDLDRNQDDLERIEGQGYRRCFEAAVTGFKIPKGPKSKPQTQQEVEGHAFCSKKIVLEASTVIN